MKQMKQTKKKISISLDADLVEKLKELAKKDDRTLSRYINKLLRMHVGSGEEYGGTMYFRL